MFRLNEIPRRGNDQTDEETRTEKLYIGWKYVGFKRDDL